jgi:hypothetical protein
MTNPSGRFKLMKNRSDEELQQTITNAQQIGATLQLNTNLMVNPFWEFCAGIDAYFEQRRRKEEKDHQLQDKLQQSYNKLNPTGDK